MAEEIVIRARLEGGDQVKRELQEIGQAGEAAAPASAAGGAPPSPPPGPNGPNDPNRNRDKARDFDDAWSAAIRAKELQASRQAARERLRGSYAKARSDEEARSWTEDQMQERLNNKLVKEEAAGQGKEAKEAAAAERKAKADALRAQRGEHGREWTEDRMQERLNEQLVQEEAKRQAEEARDKKKVKKDLDEGAELNARRGDHDDSLQALELRAAGHGKEADALERQVAIRSRSRQLQRDLNMDAETATKHAERQVDAEEKISNSRSSRGPVGSAVSGFDQQTGLPLGTIFSTLSNPLALAGLAIGAVGGKLLMDRMAARDTVAREESNYTVGANTRAQIASGEFGDGAIDRQRAAQARRQQTKQELDRAKAEKGSFKNEGWDSYIDDLNTIGHALGADAELETNAARKKRENAEKIKQLERSLPEDSKQAFDEAMKGLPALGIEQQKQMLAGNMRAARDTGYEMRRRQRHDELLAEFGGKDAPGAEKMATEGANLEVALLRREEQMKFARLIDARSGNADQARATEFATGGIQRAVEHLRAEMVGQHDRWTLASYAATQKPRTLAKR